MRALVAVQGHTRSIPGIALCCIRDGACTLAGRGFARAVEVTSRGGVRRGRNGWLA